MKHMCKLGGDHVKCGWHGTIDEFLRLQYEPFEQELMDFIYGSTNVTGSDEELQKIRSQQRAWRDEYEKLQVLLQRYQGMDAWLIFEYAMVRGGGRRPDVLLLLPGHVLVIECKSYNVVNQAEYLQTSLYVRDLQHYHSTIQEENLHVTGTLLLTNHNSTKLNRIDDYQIYLASQKSIFRVIDRLVNKASGEAIAAKDFLEGVYQPTPSMIEAARQIFHHEDLPRLKAVDSSNVQVAYETIQQVIEEAERSQSHHLVLVSGEPGAGKTLLGLQIAHRTPKSVYISGNGPLVDVLQDTLQNNVFVQSLYGYKRDFLSHGRVPDEQVIIFDEAQRAWDAEKMKRDLSEPDVIMQIAKKDKPWSVVIGLVGEGQEIHLGEEGGLSLWDSAIQNQNVTVHSANETNLFSYAAAYRIYDHLHLNSSLRSHSALRYYAFVHSLLDGNITEAIRLKEPLQQQRYPIFVTDNLERAKDYMRNLYMDDVKTYGILCVTGSDRLKEVNVVPFPERNVRPKPATAFFNYPDRPYYCKTLQYAATEFQTQGLELDAVIVHWDEDLYWSNDQWHCWYTKNHAKDPNNMKLNAYRVLLTRGRDATILYLPNKLKLKETWDLFVNTMKMPVL